MDSGEITVQARRLQQALHRENLPWEGTAPLEELVSQWLHPPGPPPPDPLAALDVLLRQYGLVLEAGGLVRVAWAVLGVPAVRSVRLGNAASTRLTHLAELHDLAAPSAVRALAARLAAEVNLAPDLLRARPWLSAAALKTTADVLGAVLESEWTGFLILLGEFGPWAYVPSVAAMQALSRRYAALVQAASVSPDGGVLAAAFHLQPGDPGGSLLARLEVTDYRPQRGAPRSPRANVETVAELVRLERAFWEAAEDQARQRRAEWAGRRPGAGRAP
ncbi:hypothetical protein E5F05_03240 (plasmid) [Deinococcus metallilatus]|uniref:DNA-binding ribbon-helix-helix protein n=1 Tax=Deinococcus metallilatus TaxID=1211322 RepID=A0AAJ5F5B6_9DEIO|nr:hypothetical protein [Deinococcus metallilatus]MBB5297309.1 putative DNA-binding ribbon-helix-helix protein [Deinococcus metallilatus]QBY06945.1 hypothetical protein E5F05_03240 [Deinococcus metallilatus]TLK31892.1 hypothetical protein FCS05_00005 [Deinococcus metallilatus]GMA17127.1 hypothetical protein GCM10025871_34580 [Deinococcus metallilatus]